MVILWINQLRIFPAVVGAILKRYELSFEGVGSTDVQGEVKLGKVSNQNPGDLLYIICI